MLNIGDTVVFGTEGVFTVEQITQKEICGKKSDYYALKSCCKDKSTVYLPVANQTLVSKVRPLLTELEICELLGQIADTDNSWIDDNKARKERFLDILQSGDRKEIIHLAAMIHRHRQIQESKHRKLTLSDEKILKEAERIISMEFSFVLNISQSDVPQYIQSHIGTIK